MRSIGAWCLGFLEGLIVAGITSVIVYALMPTIIRILRGLIEFGNQRDEIAPRDTRYNYDYIERITISLGFFDSLLALCGD